jgi:hypothetical protein
MPCAAWHVVRGAEGVSGQSDDVVRLQLGRADWVSSERTVWGEVVA